MNISASAPSLDIQFILLVVVAIIIGIAVVALVPSSAIPSSR